MPNFPFIINMLDRITLLGILCSIRLSYGRAGAMYNTNS